MQSIENLLSPAGQSVEHDFAFESKSSMGMANKRQKSPTLRPPQTEKSVNGRDSQTTNGGNRDAPGDGTDVTTEYSLDEEMAEYDVDPLPLNVVMSHDASSTKKLAPGVSEKGTRSRGIIIEQKSHWQKKDVVTKGQYKPWFFSRFAKSRIPLGKPQCLADLKVISNSSRNAKSRHDGSDSERNGSQTKSRKCKSEDERTSSRRRKTQQEEDDDDDDDDEEEEEELWVECENCKKWRKVPAGVEIDQEKSFFCQMLPAVTCETAEEAWDEEETEWVEDADTKEGSGGGGGKRGASPHNGENQAGSNGASKGGGGYGEGQGSKKRRAASGAEAAGEGGDSRSPLRARKSRRPSPGSPHSVCSDEPLSPEDITAASSLYGGGGGGGSSQGMSRLAAVVRVLRATGRALHYDALTKQALRLGLIRFTGSQGTAGESMKAFLNKTIREHKTAAVVNLGKGVYGLKQWQTGPDPAVSSCGPGSGGAGGGEAWQGHEPLDGGGCKGGGESGKGKRGAGGEGARGEAGRAGMERESGSGGGRGGGAQDRAVLLAN